MLARFFKRKNCILFYRSFKLNNSFNIHSLISTPDSPLLFFWSLSAYYFYKAFFESSSYKNWSLAGLFAGFGLFSKYSAVFLFISAFAFLIFNKEKRKELLSFKPISSAFFAFVAFAPVIYWNMSNGWASFLFQSSTRAKGMTRLKIDYFPQLLASQLYELTPIFFILFFAAAYKLVKSYWKDKGFKSLFLAAFSLPIVAFFSAVSCIKACKNELVIAGYLTLIIAFAGLYGETLFNKSASLIKKSAYISRR